MYDALAKDDARTAISRFPAFRADPATRDVPMEEPLNLFGYELMAAFGPKQALPVLALNVEEHPESGTAHDSLGEAYLALGDVDHAREHYRLAAKLDSRNENPRRILERLPIQTR